MLWKLVNSMAPQLNPQACSDWFRPSMPAAPPFQATPPAGPYLNGDASSRAIKTGWLGTSIWLLVTLRPFIEWMPKPIGTWATYKTSQCPWEVVRKWIDEPMGMTCEEEVKLLHSDSEFWCYSGMRHVSGLLVRPMDVTTADSLDTISTRASLRTRSSERPRSPREEEY